MTMLALTCIPWMLITKPFIQFKEHKKFILERKLRGDVELESLNPYEEVQQSGFEQED